MVLLRILSKKEETIREIAEMLLREHLAINISVKPNGERLEWVNETAVSSPLFLLTAKTKGLLFDHISKVLEKRYKDEMPEMYSIAIVHMDWDQARHLANDIVPV